MKLVVRGLAKRLGARQILRSLNLECSGGDLVVVIGENGSGKSTLLRVVAGIFEPDVGALQIDGHDVRGGGVVARQHVAYVPDASDPLPDLTVREFLALIAALKGAPLPDGSLYERLHVAAILDQRLGSLSFGQRKRTCLLSAHIGEPWLWLLDEPTNGIDPEGVRLIEALLSERPPRQRATLLATNDLPFVRALHAGQAARVLRLCEGSLVEWRPETDAARP